MKIIIVIHSNIFGGAERHTVVLAKELKKRGHTVIFTCPKKSWMWNALRDSDIELINLPLNGTYDMYSLLRLSWIAKSRQADIIHGHLTRSAFYANWASRLSGVPSIVSARATNTYKHFNGARKIIAVSNAVKEHLVSKGYRAEDITVVYNGVEDIYRYKYERDYIRNSLGLKKDEIAVVLLGRFIRDKGQDIALNAIAEIRQLPLKLILIGDYQNEWGSVVKETIARMDLHEKVILLGHREDARRLLVAMDILIQPSRREAFPHSVLEGLSAGLPILASNVGGHPEIVTDEFNGFLFANEDYHTLANQLRLLIEDFNLREKLSKNSRQLYLERFTIDRMIENTLNVYRQVIGETNETT